MESQSLFQNGRGNVRIEILCGSGSPDGVHVSDIHGQNGRVGVGGAELALLTLCEGWTKSGHEVVLYNNPKRNDGVFEQRATVSFDKLSKRDVLIVFREPSSKIINAVGKRVFFSCDQYTQGDFRHFSQFVDKVVTISPFHSKYFADTYEIRETTTIDLPVRLWEYETPAEKVPNRIVFTSVPDRGLALVAKIFPHIRDVIPDASLVITSDYRLWGIQSPNNAQFVQMFMRQRNVEFLGAIPREKLVQEQMKSQIHLYPFSRTVSEELFCIAVAESQVAGVLPITTPDGALETTNMGVLIHGNGNDVVTQQIMAQKVIEYLQNKNLPSIQKGLQQKAKERFSLGRILKEWDERVFNDC